ncbi:MAG: nitronate monooxygenase [Alphaproteobacteria bacterium]
MISTEVTRAFGMTYPIFSAGMARVSQAPLVAAVSEAGGMGCLGGVSYYPEALRQEIRNIRALTSRPFAVNLLAFESPESAEGWAQAQAAWNGLSPAQREKLKGVEPLLMPGMAKDQVAVVLEERPAALVLAFGAPRTVLEACHARGIKAMAICGSVGRAVAASASGYDYVIAQGTEGGGHTGHVGTLVLVSAIVDAVRQPVIAAGGIVDGRGLAAALCLGAQAVWCGTRFVASTEAYGHDAYKRRIVTATVKDTTVTAAYTGKSLRTLRNAWTDRWERAAPPSAGFPAQYAIAAERVESGYQDGDIEEGMMPAGQGAGLIRDIPPAGEIVRRMAHDAARILESLGREVRHDAARESN